ncbi:MAG: hypothetical protein WC621_01825 [Patescibacteria group bacterium]
MPSNTTWLALALTTSYYNFMSYLKLFNHLFLSSHARAEVVKPS